MARRKVTRTGNSDRESFISGKEDMRWLRDTHIPKLSVKRFKSAMIYGNEDCPRKVMLYTGDNPSFGANAVVYKRRGSSCKLKRR